MMNLRNRAPPSLPPPLRPLRPFVREIVKRLSLPSLPYRLLLSRYFQMPIRSRSIATGDRDAEGSKSGEVREGRRKSGGTDRRVDRDKRASPREKNRKRRKRNGGGGGYNGCKRSRHTWRTCDRKKARARQRETRGAGETRRRR